MRLKILTIAFVISIFISACGIKTTIENNDHIIFKETLKVINLNKDFLLENGNNDFVYELIEEEVPRLIDLWEFDSTKNFINYEDAFQIFNNNELEFFKNQIDKSYKWKKGFYTKILTDNNLKKLENLTYKPFQNNHLDVYVYFKLSKILYTSNRDYALIYYGYSATIADFPGESGLLIFKKTNGKWKYLTRLFYSFS